MLINPLERDPSRDAQGGTASAIAGAGGKTLGGESGAENGGDNSSAGAGGLGGEGGVSGEGGLGGEGGVDGYCETNAECMDEHLGEPHRCLDHTCVPLATSDCTVYGDAKDDDAVFIGAYGIPEDGQLGDSTSGQTYRLAIKEFQNAMNLPGPNGTRRELVTILCNNDEARLERTLQHLIEGVQVPGIIAALDPGTMLKAFNDHRSSKTFFLSPFGGSSAVSVEPDEGLMWNMLGQPSDFVPLYQALIARLEQTIKATGVSSVRIAAVRSSDTFSDELGEAVMAKLRFNDKSVSDNLKDGNWLLTNLDPNDPESWTDPLNNLLRFKPSVVISFATNEAFSFKGGVVRTLEVNWGFTDGAPRAYFIFSPKNDQVGTLIGDWAVQPLMSVPDTYKRYLAVSAAPAEDRTLYDAFARNLQGQSLTTLPVAENFYDAFYFMAYAIHGAGNVANLRGPDLARGMRRLLSMDPQLSVDVGPGVGNIPKIFQILSQPGTSVRLMGTLGPPDFNVDTGVRVESGSLSCFDKDFKFHDYVLRFDRKEERFRGTFAETCYSGLFDEASN